MSDDAKFNIAMVLFIALFIFIGFVIGRGFTKAQYREESIKRGFAEYNQTTGEWQWKGNDGPRSP